MMKATIFSKHHKKSFTQRVVGRNVGGQTFSRIHPEWSGKEEEKMKNAVYSKHEKI
jgi:hypothetical protein